jgi:predicted ester cyclase
MEETMLKSEALAEKNMLAYFQTHDVKYIAEDAVFRNMATGECYRGRAEIGAMLHYMYQVAFDAKAEMKSYIITAGKAQVEGDFVGRHTGEFAGIPATNKEVRVPMCVTYDLKDGLIQEARIFVMADVLIRQFGVSMRGPKQTTAYLVLDIFYLKFGQFKEARKLIAEAVANELLPDKDVTRVFSDFTGDSYRLIFEDGFASLNEYEASLTNELKSEEWQQWYNRFKPLVERSHREILKQVM